MQASHPILAHSTAWNPSRAKRPADIGASSTALGSCDADHTTALASALDDCETVLVDRGILASVGGLALAKSNAADVGDCATDSAPGIGLPVFAAARGRARKRQFPIGTLSQSSHPGQLGFRLHPESEGGRSCPSERSCPTVDPRNAPQNMRPNLRAIAKLPLLRRCRLYPEKSEWGLGRTQAAHPTATLAPAIGDSATAHRVADGGATDPTADGRASVAAGGCAADPILGGRAIDATLARKNPDATGASAIVTADVFDLTAAELVLATAVASPTNRALAHNLAADDYGPTSWSH